MHPFTVCLLQVHCLALPLFLHPPLQWDCSKVIVCSYPSPCTPLQCAFSRFIVCSYPTPAPLYSVPTPRLLSAPTLLMHTSTVCLLQGYCLLLPSSCTLYSVPAPRLLSAPTLLMHPSTVCLLQGHCLLLPYSCTPLYSVIAPMLLSVPTPPHAPLYNVIATRALSAPTLLLRSIRTILREKVLLYSH